MVSLPATTSTSSENPYLEALMSLSDLESHMGNFLLASQRLTRSGQGEPPYHYFELFLNTVSGFPSVAHSMTTYYGQYLAILQQSLATLFPFLEKMRDPLAKTDPASPFSGAAKGPAHQPRKDSSRSRDNARLASPPSTPIFNAGAPTDLSSSPPTPLAPTPGMQNSSS